MRRIVLTLVLVSAAGPAFARELTCWYDEFGEYAGADGGNYGNAGLGQVSRLSDSGPQAWAYPIEAPDGSACPRALTDEMMPRHSGALTCWFDQDGNFSEAIDGNQLGAAAFAGPHCGYAVQACSEPQPVDAEGDHAWGYVITEWQDRLDGIGPCLIMIDPPRG